MKASSSFPAVFQAALFLSAVGQMACAGQAADESPLPPVESARGKAVYQQQCAACHGQTGDGNGPAAVWLYPKPRNFSAGLFKIQSTPAGSLPTDEDLLRSVTRGLPGSSMPGFAHLPEAERRDVVQYVKFLTVGTDASGKRVNRFAAAGPPARAVDVPAEPPVTVQSLALGKEMFAKMQCNSCHGETGAGDGPQVPSLKDAFGYPARPRDFNTGAFRGGQSGRDLYLRIHNGLAGTPMAPYGPELMTPEQRWALVHYVLSLRRTDVSVNDILAPETNRIPVPRVKSVPRQPQDPAWESFDPVRVPLNPLWPEPDPVYAVALTALHDGKRIAFLCQWRDLGASETPIRMQDFQDAVALQFSLTGRTPFVGMGDADNPVNLWQWKAGWQQEIAGQTPDLRTLYPAMHVDTYFARSYETAADAGNPIAIPRPSPVEDGNARGFGSFTTQPTAAQNVKGHGIWQGGFWNVVFVRELKSRDKDDVQFRKNAQIPVAFAVWNGEQGDRNGRKAISNWFQLELE